MAIEHTRRLFQALMNKLNETLCPDGSLGRRLWALWPLPLAMETQ